MHERSSGSGTQALARAGPRRGVCRIAQPGTRGTVKDLRGARPGGRVRHRCRYPARCRPHGRGIASSLGQAASLTGTYPFSFQGLPVTDPCRGVQSSPNPETRGPHGGPPSGLRNRPCAKDEAARASNHPDWLAGAAMAQPRSVRGVLAARRVHVHVYLPPPSVKTSSRIDLSLYPSERERQVQQQDNGCALRFSGPSGPELSPQRGQGDHGPRAGSKQTRPTCGF